MGTRPRFSPMTVEEFYRLPDDGTRLELVAGRVVSEPLAGSRHGVVAAAVVEFLRAHVRTRKLGKVFTSDSGFVLSHDPDTVRGPDVAFVSADRARGRVPKTAFEGSPDLGVEVLSPFDRANAVHGKVADYLAAGTRLVWVVDPETETVTVYRSLFAPRTLEKGDVLEGEDVVPGFRIAAEELFEE